MHSDVDDVLNDILQGDVEVHEPEEELDIEEYMPEDGIEEPIEEIDISLEKVSTFDENLVPKLSQSTLDVLSSDILEGIEQDLQSRDEWEQTLAKGIQFLGIGKEVKKNKSELLANTNDPIMLNAWLNWMSTVPELFPEEGISDYVINGHPSPEVEQSAENRKNFLNKYLRNIDIDYRPDSESMYAWLGLSGCTFKKVYMDPVKKVPKARFVKPQDMILDNEASCLNACQRITQVQYLTKKDIALYEEIGFFSKEDEPSEDNEQEDTLGISQPVDLVIKDIYGIDNNYDKKSQFRYFECHVFLGDEGLIELEGSAPSFPIPYVVYICEQTRKIVAIYRDWEEGDKNYDRERIFVQYNYIKGLGIYGLGLVHVLGGAAKMLTVIERMLLDAGSYANTPGGIIASNQRIEETNIAMDPGQFKVINSLSGKASDLIAPFPYKEPSVVLKDLMFQLRELYGQIDYTLFNKVPEHAVNTPATTTIAMLEVQSRIQSMVIKSVVTSLDLELKMIDALFKKSFTEDPFSTFDGTKQITISIEDYKDDIEIIAACEREVSTASQRMLRNNMVLDLAQKFPQLYNLRAINEMILKDAKVANIDSFLLSEEVVQQQNQQAAQEKPIDPVKAMLDETAQRREAAQLKAQTDEKRIEVEGFKAQLKFEGDMHKIELEKEMSEDRNETALEVEELKHDR